jgi:hypothetical protein
VTATAGSRDTAHASVRHRAISGEKPTMVNADGNRISIRRGSALPLGVRD